jgi:hypothetical protein
MEKMIMKVVPGTGNEEDRRGIKGKRRSWKEEEKWK